MKKDICRLELVMDALNRGFIAIDKNKILRRINNKALDMTGMAINDEIKHPSGVLEKGDIVVILDNDMGNDDGNLTSSDLKLLNIHDKDIEQGDAILVAGVYKSKVEPMYKYFREHQSVPNIKMKCSIKGHDIVASIQGDARNMNIAINGENYIINYQNSVGHMVIVDGNTGKIKFIQARGYSVRGETVKEILCGHRFLAKPIKADDIRDSIIGKPYTNFFDETNITESLCKIVEGKEVCLREKLYEINKRIFLCDVLPYYEIDDNDKEIKDEILGAYIVLQSSKDLEALLDNRNNIIETIESNFRKQIIKSKGEDSKGSRFIGNSIQANEVRYLSHKAAKNKFNVLLTGESGTGKSMLAKEIHKLGDAEKPYVEVHCNAITNSLFESELFGYVAGAFTGASQNGKMGYFEEANGGTILLDEIGEIPPEIQVKLLQVLQEKVIYRVGSSKPTKIDVRVIVATNKDLAEEVKNGKFRQDLFYRINIFPINIVPIRERKSDIYTMASILLKRVCNEYNIPEKQLSGEAMNKIMSYNWPGNVRELENCIERAVVLCESNLIYPEHLNILSGEKQKTFKEQIEEEEIRIIRTYLDRTNGDKLKAAKELNISKSVFYEKLKKYNIS